LAQRPGHRIRPDRAGPVGDRAALRTGSVRGAQGLSVDRRFDRVFSCGRQCGPVALVGAAAGDPGAAGRVVPRVAAPAHRRRQRLGAQSRWRRGAVPAAVHHRDGTGAGRTTGQGVPLPVHRFTRRCVLQGRHQPRHRLDLDGIRAGQPNTVATRWCGWTVSSAATSRRWVG
jgi:hypothetical protein